MKPSFLQMVRSRLAHMTILRKAEYRSLVGTPLSGRVLDLGGRKGSAYYQLFTGDFSITTANLSSDSDIVCDFEQPLPIESEKYDAVLLINVLEHIFEYRQLLGEVARVLRPGGMVIIVVPFLFPYHASPDDFHRYTAKALEHMLVVAGFEGAHITTLGSGVCASCWMLIERLLPRFLSPLSRISNPFVALCDWLFSRLAHLLGKKYLASDYALGYTAVARLPV